MGYYWNTNSTTRIRPEVSKVLNKYIDSNNDDVFHNPSDSSIASGRIYNDVISAVRKKFKDFINASAEDFAIFTSCGSESNNIALATGEKFVGKNGTIIISAVEHDSINLRCEHLKQLGYDIQVIDVDSKGRYNYEQLNQIKTTGRVFISVMLVNNELGNIYDVKRISSIARNKWKQVLIHTDAVQALGKIKIDVKELGVDMLTVSGHKIGGPKGIGALYVKKGVSIQPLIYGHQECGCRGGTENTPYIAAFGKALEIAERQMTAEYDKIIQDYRDKLESGILDICKSHGFNAYVNGDVRNRVNNTSSLTIDGIDNVALIILASGKSIYFSNGAACNSAPCAASYQGSDATKSSAVLKAICHPNYKGVIRLSVGDELFCYGLSEYDYDTSSEKDIIMDIKTRVNVNLKTGLKILNNIFDQLKKQKEK